MLWSKSRFSIAINRQKMKKKTETRQKNPVPEIFDQNSTLRAKHPRLTIGANKAKKKSTQTIRQAEETRITKRHWKRSGSSHSS